MTINESELEYEKRLNKLFVTNVGSHTWRMNRPDSDLDLFIVHIVDSKKILMGTCDINSRYKEDENGKTDRHIHEIGAVVHQILDNNFNFIIGVLSPVVVKDWDRLDELRELTLNNLSRKCFDSINGLAYKNYKKYVVSGKDTGNVLEKRCKLIERTLKFGIRLLAEGEIRFDSVNGCKPEDIPLLLTELRRAYENSVLPNFPEKRDDILEWLLQLRLEHMNNE